MKHAGRLNKGPHRAISGDSNRQFEHRALGKFVKELVGSEALALRHDDTTRRPANLEENHEHKARRRQNATGWRNGQRGAGRPAQPGHRARRTQ